MSHRTQITLTDEQYDLLCRESKRSGVAIAELVRRAVDERYERSSPTIEERRRAFAEAAGLWSNRTDEEIDSLMKRMRPGLGHRLARHGRDADRR
jgi:hypothetical protein